MAWDYDKVIARLEDTMTVLVGVQERQAARIKDHTDWLETLQQQEERHRQFLAEHQRFIAEHDKNIADHEQWKIEHDKGIAKIRLLMSEMGEKLDALIHIVDDNIRGRSGQN